MDNNKFNLSKKSENEVSANLKFDLNKTENKEEATSGKKFDLNKTENKEEATSGKKFDLNKTENKEEATSGKKFDLNKTGNKEEDALKNTSKAAKNDDIIVNNENQKESNLQNKLDKQSIDQTQASNLGGNKIDNNETKKSESKKTLWIILAIIILLIVIFAIGKSCETSTNDPNIEPSGLENVKGEDSTILENENNLETTELSEVQDVNGSQTSNNYEEKSDTEFVDKINSSEGTNSDNKSISSVSTSTNMVEKTNSSRQKSSQSTTSLTNNNIATTEKRINVEKNAPLSEDITENAMRAIRGDFGNGTERKQKLGENYKAIQKRINELLKK